ncbi:MAG: hypothetical protein OEV00_10390 [Acidobacteriota bacterium]|nr:hypothetical protein [Acidobacteriota bacterium]MDH3785719.1 hypothetical protein [Acidobacteriota bacterium]
MAVITKKIGLSLGADICWPVCFEELVRRLDLTVPSGKDSLRFEVERVTIEPFDLQQPCDYSVVVDRLTHWFNTSREWIKKSIIMDDLYVFNNPWSVQSMEKATTYAAMMHLGLPVPRTWLVPPKEHLPSDDLEPTLKNYARLFDLDEIGTKLEYPMFMKPYDGGAWVGVSRIDNAEKLKDAYEESGTRVMHLQSAVDPFDLFVRIVGIGPQTRVIRYDPAAPLHDRYKVDFDVVTSEEHSLLRDITLTINSYFGWDFNSCECLRQEDVFYPIDFANPCPDSQVTSLHYHFPWVVMAQVRWALYCAATNRKMHQNLDWAPFEKIRQEDLPYRERVRRYAAIAEERLDTKRFEDFCGEHLPHFDEVALDFFQTDVARNAVREKVEALFPENEHDRFDEHFWGLIQFWRQTELDKKS